MRGVVSRSMDCMVYGSSVAISRGGMRSVVSRSVVSRGVVIHISMVVRHMVRGMCRGDIGRFVVVGLMRVMIGLMGLGVAIRGGCRVMVGGNGTRVHIRGKARTMGHRVHHVVHHGHHIFLHHWHHIFFHHRVHHMVHHHIFIHRVHHMHHIFFHHHIIC